MIVVAKILVRKNGLVQRFHIGVRLFGEKFQVEHLLELRIGWRSF